MIQLHEFRSPQAVRSFITVIDMAPRVDNIMRLCCEISAHKKIKVTFKNPVKEVAKEVALVGVMGGSAFVGGLVGGPVGMAVGGAVGGLLGRWMTRGHFQPLSQILMELSPSQKQKLYNDIRRVLGRLEWLDWISPELLIFFVMRNADLKQQVISVLINYVTKDLKAKVRYQK